MLRAVRYKENELRRLSESRVGKHSRSIRLRGGRGSVSGIRLKQERGVEEERGGERRREEERGGERRREEERGGERIMSCHFVEKEERTRTHANNQ